LQRQPHDYRQGLRGFSSLWAKFVGHVSLAVVGNLSEGRYNALVGDERPLESAHLHGGFVMHRLTVTEAERNFSGLVNRVCSEGIGVELQRGDSVIAYLTPARPQSPLKVRDLNAFFQRLPKLEEDADAFAADLRAIRSELPAEADPWG
jgi:antitoxin (DNA-binding transcriptional repressor) of toxin-antitoxin stability system